MIYFVLGITKYQKHFVQGMLPKRTKREEIPPLLQNIGSMKRKSPLRILLHQFFTPIDEARSKLENRYVMTLRDLFEKMSLIHGENHKEPTKITTIAEEILTMSLHFDRSLIPLPSLISEVETRQKGVVSKHNNVHILTIHRSKGLEFDYVFIPSVQPGFFPQKCIVRTPEFWKKRERLFYVAMTRTKKKLFLSRYQSTEEYPWSGFLDECFDLNGSSSLLRLYMCIVLRHSKTSPSFSARPVTNCCPALFSLFGS